MSDREGRRDHGRGRVGRIARAIGDASLMSATGRGARSRAPDGETLLSRAALLDEGRHDYEERRPEGLLERVPGWSILAVVVLVLAGVLFLTDWAR